jgi:hypothetical protein
MGNGMSEAPHRVPAGVVTELSGGLAGPAAS